MLKNGCAVTIYKQLILEENFAIYIPNAFTPNNDKINDTWGPEGIGISDKDYSLLVFDRWGEKIFEGKALNDRWDGTYNDVMVKNDVYVYKLNCKAINKARQKCIRVM